MSGLIVHEWIEKTGGAEKVVDAMLDQYKDADIYCLWNDNQAKYQHINVRESVLARTPIRRNKPLAVLSSSIVWRGPRVKKNYDWILVSSHLFAHQFRQTGINRNTPKFVYVHTPARYIWSPDQDPRGAGLPARIASSFLQPVDRHFAQELEHVAANSEFVRNRILQTWGIDSRVIYPPVDVSRITSRELWVDALNPEETRLIRELPDKFILGASRFVPYKQLDTVIKSGEAADIPVVLAGSGPDEARLRNLASESRVPVFFVLSPSDALLFALYQAAMAFVFPAVEDFGIMPVEAMAAGVPVIVNSQGGASETVLDGTTGIHLSEFDSQSIVRALEATESMSRDEIRARANKFSLMEFKSQLKGWMEI